MNQTCTRADIKSLDYVLHIVYMQYQQISPILLFETIICYDRNNKPQVSKASIDKGRVQNYWNIQWPKMNQALIIDSKKNIFN